MLPEIGRNYASSSLSPKQNDIGVLKGIEQSRMLSPTELKELYKQSSPIMSKIAFGQQSMLARAMQESESVRTPTYEPELAEEVAPPKSTMRQARSQVRGSKKLALDEDESIYNVSDR